MTADAPAVASLNKQEMRRHLTDAHPDMVVREGLLRLDMVVVHGQRHRRHPELCDHEHYVPARPQDDEL